MPKYRYTRLKVMCLEVRHFGVGQLREAVEYLKTVPESQFTGLVAEAETVSAGPFLLQANPMLGLARIRGKTAAQVWKMFDDEVDRQVWDLERRAH